MAGNGIPSLNEITSVRGDANIGYGTQGVGGSDVKYDFNKGLEMLQEAARMKQQNAQYKLDLFQRNLEDFYKNFNQMDVSGVMEQDYPAITAEYANLTKDLAENYDIIRNPMKDPNKFAMLKQRESALRGRIAQSKQDLAYRKFNQEFLLAHPEFNNDENRSRIDQFTQAGIGQRRYDSLTNPYLYDPTTYANAARDAAKQQMIKDFRAKGMYIDHIEDDKVDPDVFLKFWKAAHSNMDKYSRTGYEEARAVYDKTVPKGQQSQLTFDTWLDNMGKTLMGVPVTKHEETLKTDEPELEIYRQGKEDARQTQRLNQEAAQFYKTFVAQYGDGAPKQEQMGEAKAKLWTLMVLGAKLDGRNLQPAFGDNTVITKEVIGDGGVIKVPMPRTEVIESMPEEVNGKKTGNTVIRFRNNETGRMFRKTYSPAELHSDLDNMFSNYKNVKPTDVSEGERMWRKRIAGVDQPDAGVYMRIFHLDENGDMTSENPSADSEVKNAATVVGKSGKTRTVPQ